MNQDKEQMTSAPDGCPCHQQPRWRQDFPIDWPQDHYIARRDFTKFMALTSLAFAIGQVWVFARNIWRKRQGQLPIKRIAAIGQIPIGGALSFSYPNEHDACLLARLDETTFVAYDQKCTHLSCAVVPDAKEAKLHCPCHNGYFDLKTGAPIAGPPRRPLPRITLEIKSGAIYATDVEVRTI